MNRLLIAKLRRDLRHRWALVAAVACSVMLGVATFIVTSGLAGDLRASYDETYERTRFGDVWASGDPDALLGAVGELDGVERAEARTSGDVGATLADRPITTRIVGYGPDTELNQLVVDAGRADLGQTSSSSSSSQPAGVVLERHTAEHFGLGPGDRITIAGHGEVEVIGVATSPEWLWVAPSQQDLVVDPDNFAVVFAPEALAAELAPPGSGQVVVTVAGHDPGRAEAVAGALLQAGATGVFTRATHPSNSALQADVDGFDQLAAIMPVLFLGAAALSAAVLLGRLIAQQRAEIGMMRANGFTRSTLVAHYGLYGVVIAASGAAVGVPLGIAGSQAATGAYADFLGIPFAARSFHPLTWLVGIAIAVAAGALAGIAPARAAAAIDPATAMRPAGASEGGRRSALERVLPGRAPSWLVVAARNLQRHPRRVGTTGLGIVLSLVLCVSGLVLNDTISGLFDRQFGDIDHRELVVVFDRESDPALVGEVAAVAGVEVAEPYLETGAAALAGGEIAAVRLQVFEPGTALHGFEEPLPTEGVVLTASVADALGIAAGGEVELRVGGEGGGVGATIPVAALADEPFGGSAYVSSTAWEALGGLAPMAVGVGLDDPETHREVADELSQLDGAVRVSDVVATSERARELLAAATFFAGLILALAVMMAGALIFTSLTVTVGERETEVATLAANGVGRRWIRRAVTSENLLAAVLATVPGLVLGRILAGWFVSQFSTGQITFDPILRPGSLAIAVVLILATALVAQLPGLWRLDRLDLAVKVRERAL